MRIEEIALRQEARQMLCEAGLSKEELKDLVLKDIDDKNSELCRNLTYKDMLGMTLEDAIYIVQKPINEYYNAKNEQDRMWLPRAHMIRAFEMLIEAAMPNTDLCSKELQVKEILSKEVFDKMSDQGAAQVLRSILFANKNNVIDWTQALYSIQKYMPELKR